MLSLLCRRLVLLSALLSFTVVHGLGLRSARSAAGGGSAVAPAARRKRVRLAKAPAAAAAGASSSGMIVGYTDCSAQSPAPEDQQWWAQAAAGHRPPFDANGHAFPVQVGDRNLAVCMIPKNGCTYWKSLILRMQGNVEWANPDHSAVHKAAKSEVSRGWTLFEKPDVLTLMLVRNPVARVLSAYLDKATNITGYYHEMLQPFNPDLHGPASFTQFVLHIQHSVEQGKADPHWKLQSDACALPGGAEWDIHLKVECRALWGPSLFNRYDMHRWTDSGWGSDGRQPFIPTGSVGAAPTEIRDMEANDPAGTHIHGADQVSQLCKWYTEENFLRVVSIYVSDILQFGYTDDVERLASACGFSAGLKTLLGNGASMRPS